MSEKRFTLTDWHEVKDNGKIMTVDEVVGLLNKLDSVNKLLKLKNENLKEMFEQSEERAEHWKSLYENLYEKVGGNYGKES